MKTQLQPFHRQPRLGAGLAAILLGTTAMAAVVPWPPVADERPAEVYAPDPAPAAKTRCAECGFIVSTREIEARSGEAAPNSPRRYEITVRLADGSRRVIDDASAAHWRAGERMTLIDGVHAPAR